MIFNEVSCISIRANPNLRFTPFDDISDEARVLLSRLISIGAYAGILEDKDNTPLRRTIKTVSDATSKMIRSLDRPRLLRSVQAEFGMSVAVICNLVLDGLLEATDGGLAYVSGPIALSIFLDSASASAPRSHLSHLSQDAIGFYSSVNTATQIDLAWKLYQFNRLPVTPESVARWSRPDFGELMLDRMTPLQRVLLDKRFVRVREAERLGWLAWTARTPREPSDFAERCKLYISPRPEHTGWALREVISHMPESGATGFKLGIYAHGIMRPDKLVLYFDSVAALRRSYALLEPPLSAVHVQGVPFSCQLDQRGLFSWGEDPQVGGHLSWHSDDSWRMWVCNRLAGAIFEGRSSRMSAKDIYEYALVRLRLQGVNVENWTRSHLH